MMALNDKQMRFVDEYIIDLNATQAAKRAGYNEKSAYSQGQRLLKHDEIKAALQERMEERQSALIMRQEEVLQRLTRQGRREETDYKVVTLKSKEISDGIITEDERAEVVELPTSNSDTIRALELLGKRYAMWTDKQDITQKSVVVNVGEYDDDDND